MKPQDILLGGGSWDSPPWLFMDKLSSRASKLLVWGCGSDRLASHQVLCSACTPSSVLQLGEGTGCDYYLIAAGMNLVCQHIHVLLVASPSFSVTVSIPVVSPLTGSLAVPMLWDHNRGIPQIDHNAEGALIASQGSLLSLEAQRKPLLMVLYWPRGVTCGASFLPF